VRFFTGRWAGVKDMPLEYSNGDSWEKMLEQGDAASSRAPSGDSDTPGWLDPAAGPRGASGS